MRMIRYCIYFCDRAIKNSDRKAAIDIDFCGEKKIEPREALAN